jgi:hypothetical protein
MRQIEFDTELQDKPFLAVPQEVSSRQACLEFSLKPIRQMRATFGLIIILGLDDILLDRGMKLELHAPPRRTPAQRLPRSAARARLSQVLDRGESPPLEFLRISSLPAASVNCAKSCQRGAAGLVPTSQGLLLRSPARCSYPKTTWMH